MNKQRRGDYTGTPNTNKVLKKVPTTYHDPNKKSAVKKSKKR